MMRRQRKNVKEFKKLPPNISEQEFLDAFLPVMERVKKKYKYGIHDGNDIAQEAYQIAVKACHSYDRRKGPLYNFISVAVTSRVFNFLRDHKKREPRHDYIEEVSKEFVPVGNMRTTNTEFWDTVDENLNPRLRSDYVKMIQGIRIPKSRRDKIIKEIKSIVDENF